jgi:enoyl-CoA hydratase/carnithine racemase
MAEVRVEGPDEGGVATLVLDRPAKRNALSIAVRDEVADALALLAGDERLKCLVVTGAGDVFSAGFDLREFAVEEPGFAERLWASSDRFHHAVLGFPLPTIAAVNGPALAGGFDLALLCDIRVAAASARFAHPEQSFGDVVFAPLADAVGGAVARELALTGREVDAAEALRLGLVSAVVPDEELPAEAARWAAMVCRGPRANLVRTKAKALRRLGLDPGTATLDL